LVANLDPAVGKVVDRDLLARQGAGDLVRLEDDIIRSYWTVRACVTVRSTRRRSPAVPAVPASLSRLETG
jgi:hypothetical protein